MFRRFYHDKNIYYSLQSRDYGNVFRKNILRTSIIQIICLIYILTVMHVRGNRAQNRKLHYKETWRAHLISFLLCYNDFLHTQCGQGKSFLSNRKQDLV